MQGDSDKFSEDMQDVEGSSVVFFNGRAFRYYLARPMALKTSRIDMLKLEACYQQRELGELTGEVSNNTTAAKQERRGFLFIGNIFFLENPDGVAPDERAACCLSALNRS